MADMTKKHYVLIADAINSALSNLREDLISDGHTGHKLTHLLRLTKMAFEDSFVERLRYTHDKFDNNEFLTMVRLPGTPIK